MADNIAVTAGTGTTIAADDIGAGVLAQRVKPVWGPDGTGNDIDVATGKPLPVQVRSATGLIPIGEPTDAKATATDTTSVSLISVAKQISASAQTLVSTGMPITNANTNGAAASASSAPVVIATNQATISTTQDTSMLSNGVTGTNLTPKFKVISASSSGVNIVVAAVTSKKIRVLAWDVKVNSAVNFKWQSHTTPTDLTGLYYCSAQGDGVARSFNPLGYFESVAGESLDINLSGAVAVGGVLTYVEV